MDTAAFAISETLHPPPLVFSQHTPSFPLCPPHRPTHTEAPLFRKKDEKGEFALHRLLK